MNNKQYKEMAQMMLDAADMLWAINKEKLTKDNSSIIMMNVKIYDYLREHGYPEDTNIVFANPSEKKRNEYIQKSYQSTELHTQAMAVADEVLRNG